MSVSQRHQTTGCGSRFNFQLSFAHPRPWLAKLRYRQAGGRSQSDSDLDLVILKNYLHVLRQFIALIRDNGGTPVFVIQASSGASPKGLHLTRYSREGAGLARELGVTVVDAAKIVTTYEGDARDLFSDTGVHYSAEGARRLAEHLHEVLFVN